MANKTQRMRSENLGTYVSSSFLIGLLLPLFRGTGVVRWSLAAGLAISPVSFGFGSRSSGISCPEEGLEFFLGGSGSGLAGT